MSKFSQLLLIALLIFTASIAHCSELDSLTSQKYKSVSSIKKLPTEIQSFIASRTSERISDKGGPFRASDAIILMSGKPYTETPTRRLLLAGFNSKYGYIYYEQGGRAHHVHFVAFRIENGIAVLIHGSRFNNWLRTEKKLFRFLKNEYPEDESEEIERDGYW